MSIHQRKDGRWVVVFYEKTGSNLLRKEKYFGRGDSARSKALQFDQDLKDLKVAAKSVSLFVTELCSRYHNQHQVRTTTSRNDAYKFQKSIIPYLGNLHAERVTSEDIHRWIARRREQGAKLSTVKRELTLLKAVFSWGSAQNPPLLSVNPLIAFRLKMNEDPDVPPPPVAEEISRILSCAEPHLRRAILIFWHTGIRPGTEMTSLSWPRVDIKGRSMLVTSARKGGPFLRKIPISDQLIPHIEQWRREDIEKFKSIEAIHLVHYNGRPVVSLKKSWAGAKRRAGIKRPMRLYDLRHRFATSLLESGHAVGFVSKLMGHSREDTTQRHYLHILDDHLRKVVESIDPIDQHDQ